jgi:hypothetical protein
VSYVEWLHWGFKVLVKLGGQSVVVRVRNLPTEIHGVVRIPKERIFIS